MRWWRRESPLVVAGVLSVSGHGLVILPAMVAAWRAPQERPHRARTELSAVDITPPQPQLQLGIERSEHSTLTWVGHEVYEQHLARLAETEQAAFELDPGARAQVRPVEAARVPTAVAEVASIADRSEALRQAIAGADRSLLEVPRPSDAAPAELSAAIPTRQQMMVLERLRDAIHIDLPREAAGADADDVAAAQSPAAAAPSPAPAQTAVDTPGEEADKQSDATSAITVKFDEIRPGKPVAAKGLELLPQRPEFTTLQRLSAWPSDPLCLMRFDAAGTPSEAVLVQGTGDSRIDRALLASLYRWRAKGEALEQLKDAETVDVVIRIVLR